MRRSPRIFSIVSLAALLGAALVAAVSARAEPPRTYQIICNPNNALLAVNREFVQDAFLKKVRVWPTGANTHPVDLAPGSFVRRRFTEEVLKRTVDAVRSFWQQRIFAGRDLPPPELGSDEEVVRFVLRDAGAIGYVSSGAALGGAKVLIVK